MKLNLECGSYMIYYVWHNIVIWKRKWVSNLQIIYDYNHSLSP